MSELLDGKYLLGRLLGQGGMGQVYEAEQTSVHRRVAVKLLRPGLAMDPEAVRRLHREAETLAKLEHPNLVRFLDFGQSDDGQVYLVMELLEGEDLMVVLDRAGPAPFERIIPILLDVLGALETCHAKGIIHRDLKPSNVFLARNPNGGAITKILDFGVARAVAYEGTALTQTGGLVGTAAYMAPEQARGENIDVRADLYSVGAILYHALTGAAPYEATTFQGVLARVLTEDPPPLRSRKPELQIPEVAERLCSWAMARDPAARPQTAAEYREAMAEAVAGRKSIPLLPRATKPKRERGARGPLFWIAAVLLLVGGVAAGAIGMASLGNGGGTGATAAPATSAPATSAPVAMTPAPSTIPSVDIAPIAPRTSAPLPPPTGEVQITPEVGDAQLATALSSPACREARRMAPTFGRTAGADAMALSVIATSTPTCGDCAAFARAAIRLDPTWDLPHFQLASCLTTRSRAADDCTIASEAERFLELSRQRQPGSSVRQAYRRSAPAVVATYRARCGRGGD